jgi:hypothetical protein
MRSRRSAKVSGQDSSLLEIADDVGDPDHASLPQHDTSEAASGQTSSARLANSALAHRSPRRADWKRAGRKTPENVLSPAKRIADIVASNQLISNVVLISKLLGA